MQELRQEREERRDLEQAQESREREMETCAANLECEEEHNRSVPAVASPEVGGAGRTHVR